MKGMFQCPHCTYKTPWMDMTELLFLVKKHVNEDCDEEKVFTNYLYDTWEYMGIETKDLAELLNGLEDTTPIKFTERTLNYIAKRQNKIRESLDKFPIEVCE